MTKTWRPCWCPYQWTLMRNLLFMGHQHGGDDVTWKPRIHSLAGLPVVIHLNYYIWTIYLVKNLMITCFPKQTPLQLIFRHFNSEPQIIKIFYHFTNQHMSREAPIPSVFQDQSILKLFLPRNILFVNNLE
jgi:hypothetical protein